MPRNSYMPAESLPRTCPSRTATISGDRDLSGREAAAGPAHAAAPAASAAQAAMTEVRRATSCQRNRRPDIGVSVPGTDQRVLTLWHAGGLRQTARPFLWRYGGSRLSAGGEGLLEASRQPVSELERRRQAEPAGHLGHHARSVGDWQPGRGYIERPG